MSEAVLHHHEEPKALGLKDVPQVFSAPATLFRRIEDTSAYGWSLAVLLVMVTLVGYAQVQTGLIDRVVDQQVEEGLAELERTQGALLDRVELRDKMDEIRKGGDFTKLLQRLGAVVLSPISMLTSILLISSALYAAVALTGRKPEYHTLMSICTYSGYVILASHLLKLVMMIVYRTTLVETSLQLLAKPGEHLWLAAFEPFRIWFWVLVGTGVCVTQQLGRRPAIVTVTLLFVMASGLHVGMAYIGH